MKVPVQCPHGCGFTLEIDMGRDHQHVQCHECRCTFCAVCVDAISVHAASFLPSPHPAQKAHLN